MEAVDLVIKGGKVVINGLITPAWVAVSGGKIVALGSGEAWPQAKKIIDATGKYVLPGIVDPECHPWPPMEEGFLSETAVAVADGITTQGMMNPAPPFRCGPYVPPLSLKDMPTFMEVFPEFIDTGNRFSMVDYFLTAAISTEENAKEIPDLAKELGVTSFKLFLHLKTGEHMKDMWDWILMAGNYYYDDGTIYRAMKNIAALGPPAILCMHCENWEIARVRKEELKAQGRTDWAAWDDASPAFCEAGHLRDYAYYAKVTGCPLYIVHITTAETIEEVVRARADGTRIVAQTAPHYLTISKDKARLNAPLRSADNFEKLWQALKTGVIDCIGTDYYWYVHIPGTREQLQGIIKYNVWEDPSPFSGSAGFSLAVMLSEGVNKGRISLERLVQVYCENTAKSFGLYPKKGVIAIGSDADFVIVDLNKTKKVTQDMVHNRVRVSIYESWELKGWPVMTILKGNVMMEWPEGESEPKIVGKPIGRYLARKLGGAPNLPH